MSESGYRFLPGVISYAVLLYQRVALSLRVVEGLLAARGIEFTVETVCRWSVKLGPGAARHIRSSALVRHEE
jgi:putative transposase